MIKLNHNNVEVMDKIIELENELRVLAPVSKVRITTRQIGLMTLEVTKEYNGYRWTDQFEFDFDRLMFVWARQSAVWQLDDCTDKLVLKD